MNTAELKPYTDLVEARDLAQWMDRVSHRSIDELSFQSYEALCNSCVNHDWAAGLAHLKQQSEASKHHWYWQKPNASFQPGHALFRAVHFAKPQCTRELIQGAEPQTLVHALLMGVSSSKRPLRMTQNRIRCLNYIAKEFKKQSSEDIQTHINSSFVVIRAILENNQPSLVQSFSEIWDSKEVWTRLWNQKTNYSEDNIFVASEHTNEWVKCVELLWQQTDDIDKIPNDVKEDILNTTQRPENTGIFPFISSQLFKKDLEHLVQHQDKPTSKRKRM